jgi:hypothetical protein
MVSGETLKISRVNLQIRLLANLQFITCVKAIGIMGQRAVMLNLACKGFSVVEIHADLVATFGRNR